MAHGIAHQAQDMAHDIANQASDIAHQYIFAATGENLDDEMYSHAVRRGYRVCRKLSEREIHLVIITRLLPRTLQSH